MACVGRDDDVRAITLGLDGAFVTQGKNSVFVDHTTASEALARELAGLAEKSGFGFVDAPVSGGEQGARNGQLTVMCGDSGADFTKACLNFARAAGLDPQALVDVISKGAAQSWQMDNRHKTMPAGQYEHGFAV